MTLKGKPVAIATIVKAEAQPAWQPGKTFVQYVVTYVDDKGTKAQFVPTRDWVSDPEAVVCNRLLANAIALKAGRQQGLTLGAEVLADAGINGRAFTVVLNDQLTTMLALGAHIGGDTQVAFFTEKNKDAREFRAWKKARNS